MAKQTLTVQLMHARTQYASLEASHAELSARYAALSAQYEAISAQLAANVDAVLIGNTNRRVLGDSQMGRAGAMVCTGGHAAKDDSSAAYFPGETGQERVETSRTAPRRHATYGEYCRATKAAQRARGVRVVSYQAPEVWYARPAMETH